MKETLPYNSSMNWYEVEKTQELSKFLPIYKNPFIGKY